MRFSYIKKTGVVVLTVLIFISTTAYRNDYFEIAKQIEIFTTLFKEINMNYVDETNPAKLMQEGLKHMLEGLDPYTTYLSEQDVESARMNRGAAYVGIGATVKESDKKLIVVEVFEGLPADEKGIKAGDEIIKIGGNEVAELEGVAQEFLNGKKNTNVSLLILSNGSIKTVVVKREGIEPKAVPTAKILADGVGYIALDRFSKTASREVENALKVLIIDEAKGVILDLRNNPGGLLQEAVKIVNLFVQKGQLVVSTKSNIAAYNQEFRTTKQPLSLEIPLVILINEKSASASEIVAGALQDLDRAVVLGTRSFGKGLVQRPKPMPYGGQLKVTISRYYTPSGRCIQALDYRNRGEDGKASRYQEINYKAFQTQNGRTVFDGGGVSPDVLGEKKESSTFINRLIKSAVVFNYVNNYYHNNSLEDIKDFKLSKSDFNQFKKRSYGSQVFLKDETVTYLNGFSGIIKDAGLAGLDDKLKELNGVLNKSKVELMDHHKEEIIYVLEKEIVRRFYYRKGMYEYYLLKNEDVITAQRLLNNIEAYLSILK
jgi:carboxyl-terminal processing protease